MFYLAQSCKTCMLRSVYILFFTKQASALPYYRKGLVPVSLFIIGQGKDHGYNNQEYLCLIALDVCHIYTLVMGGTSFYYYGRLL